VLEPVVSIETMVSVEPVMPIGTMMSVEPRVTVGALVHATAAYVTAPGATRSSRLARRIDGKHDRQCGERHK
jgi:hypothetical protein